jgi:CheY-like chemotaxis protein
MTLDLNCVEKKTVLVVDDTPDNLTLMRGVLKDFYKVKVASDGHRGLKAAATDPPPDLILLDIMMPGIDGFEVLAELKKNPATRDIPVIFVTARTDETSEAGGLEAGAVDYITKPINPVIVRARVATQLTLREARRQLEQHNDDLLQEHRTVEDILTRMRAHRQFDDRHLRYLVEPVERANGDILLSTTTLDGRQWVLVGDFTGHGLRAAVAAPLVAQLFYSQAESGGDLAQAISGINQVLCRQLPVGFFMATCIAEISAARDSLRLWRGGMPECLLFDGHGKLRETIAEARLLPLGIIEDIDISDSADTFALTPGDRLYVFSDGVTEVDNPAGEQFGLHGTIQFLASRDPAAPLDELLDLLKAFHGADRFADDITLVEIHA